MRWNDLFADLESQAEAGERAELDAEVADRSRGEQASIALVDRLVAAHGQPLLVRMAGAGEIRGRLGAVGANWLLLSEGPTDQLALLAAVCGVCDLGRRSAPRERRSPVLARLGVVAPLRAIVRDRATVRIVLRDGGAVTGTPERVGKDHLDVLVHAADEVARSAGRHRITLPFEALSTVRATSTGWG